jgi:thioredoxin reductase
MTEQSLDVLIVGGGPAGLSAALILGRMRRRVLLLDTDAPANAVSKAMHGFLSRDGTPPAEVRRVAVEQLEPYDTVERRSVAAQSASRASGGFEITLEDGSQVAARRLLLAHGMRYGLPDVEGMSELWGERIFHCPYCHGREARDRPIAIYGCGEKSLLQALLLSTLSDDVVLLCDRDSEIAAEQRERLDAAGVELVADQVKRVEKARNELRVEFTTGRPPLARHAVFILPDFSLTSDLAVSLGAALTEVGNVETDAGGQSSVPGLYAAGDAGTAVHLSVAVATGSGARAAYAMNAELVMEDTAPSAP